MPQALTPHPIAALFPDLPAADFDVLIEDIRRHGVRVPILVHRGQILDGWQRYRACQLLKKPCPMIQWNGRDPWLEVQSRNLVRRHLSKEQIYAICKIAANQFPNLAAPIQAVKAEARERKVRKAEVTHPGGADQALLRPQGRNKESADLIGAQLGISGTTVKRVDRLAREAPELVSKVAAGELSVKKALGQIALQRMHAATAKATAASMQFDADLRQVRRMIKAEWTRCPAEYRVAFLYAVQDVVRELMAEQNATRQRTFDQGQQSKAS
jgi:ParB-like chromosome segregation protein Spo0J